MREGMRRKERRGEIERKRKREGEGWGGIEYECYYIIIPLQCSALMTQMSAVFLFDYRFPTIL